MYLSNVPPNMFPLKYNSFFFFACLCLIKHQKLDLVQVFKYLNRMWFVVHVKEAVGKKNELRCIPCTRPSKDT